MDLGLVMDLEERVAKLEREVELLKEMLKELLESTEKFPANTPVQEARVAVLPAGSHSHSRQQVFMNANDF